MSPAPDPPPRSIALDRNSVQGELGQIRLDFRELVTRASATDLRLPTVGTKWTNQQLLFHMVLGYLVVRALLPLARLLGRLPRPASAAFAWLLNSACRLFHVVNYLGSCAGARLIRPDRMPRMLDRVAVALQRHLHAETDDDLGRGMYYPTSWDPYFTGYMTLAELYRYPSLHYRHHRQQLTLPAACTLTAAAT